MLPYASILELCYLVPAKLKCVVIKLTSDSRTLCYRTMLYSGKRGKKRMLKKFSLKKANIIKIRFPEWTFTKHLHTHSLNSHIMTCLWRMRRMFKKNKEPITSHRRLTLEVALITSFYFCVLSHFSCVWLCVILWTVAHQAALSMGFSRQEY